MYTVVILVRFLVVDSMRGIFALYILYIWSRLSQQQMMKIREYKQKFIVRENWKGNFYFKVVLPSTSSFFFNLFVCNSTRIPYLTYFPVYSSFFLLFRERDLVICFRKFIVGCRKWRCCCFESGWRMFRIGERYMYTVEKSRGKECDRRTNNLLLELK